MRILLVSRSLACHLAGGLEFHTLDLARGLAARGLEVHLLTTPVGAADKSAIESENLKVFDVPGVPSGRYSAAYFRRIGGTIASLIDRFSYDIVHGQEFGLGCLSVGQLGERAKVVLSVHGTITSETPLHHDVFPHLSLKRKVRAVTQFGRRWFFAPWWNRWLDHANLILTDSQFTADELHRIRPSVDSRVRIVSLGIDPEKYPEIDQGEARRGLGWLTATGAPLNFITLGRLEWQKGHEFALRALSKLQSREWRYHIIGEGSERHYLETLTRDLNLQNRVFFLGRIEENIKTRMLAAADIFIWPELTHPAFGLVALESMLMGTPVLGVRRGAIPELIDAQSGWLVEAASAESIAGKVNEIISSPEIIAGVRNGLRNRIQKRFSLDQMISGTISAYEEALRR